MDAAAPRQVYLLPLKDDGSPDVPGGYIYLPPPPSDPPYYYLLRFVVEGTSSICRGGSLWVDIPEEEEGGGGGGGMGKVEGGRGRFREFKLRPDFNRNIRIDVPVTRAGAFAFYVTYCPIPDFSVSLSGSDYVSGSVTDPAAAAASSSSTPERKQARTPTYYIDVAPKLILRGKDLPINALSIFSLVSKFMGKYPSDWEKHLHGISQRGYNMIHFTPLMTRGVSDSPYSIYDQLTFDQACFPNGETDVAEMVAKMEMQHGLLALTDVVWNHTAGNSQWLEEHPEAGYSVENAPWLEAALELDEALMRFGEELERFGLPTEFGSVDELRVVVDGVRRCVIEEIRLWEFYVVDVKVEIQRIVKEWVSGNDEEIVAGGGEDLRIAGLEGIKDWTLGQKANFLREKALSNGTQILGRFSRKVDAKVAVRLVNALFGRYDKSPSDVSAVESELVKILDELNLPLYREYNADVAEILEQIFNRVKYLRIDDHGPKLGPVTKKNPLVETYFTRLPLNETTKKYKPKALALVNNGWIWNADAMRDHAGPESRAYLRREVIIWGDCVKLRYGSSPQDNPFLWDYMAQYTRLMAKYFAGFRIDNCHSTPLVVAEYFLDEARKVRPNLIVFAELFTGSEETDYVFVKRLGINALIREAMQAWNTGELSRLVHRHGGRPIGSFDVDLPSAGSSHAIVSASSGSETECISHIRQNPVHALFMDCTHDNELPAQKRDARDTLPNAALVSMCASAVGSVMGYDEVYAKLVDVVSETRLYYSKFSECEELKVGPGEGGIGGIRKLLNRLHTMMGVEGYDETYIHHDGAYITVHRVQPRTRRGIFLIAHTAFPGCDNDRGVLAPTHLTGTEVKLIGSWTLQVDADEKTRAEISADKKFLRGLPSRVLELDAVKRENEGTDSIISVSEKFVPGSIALFETWIPGAEHSEGLSKFITSGADEAFAELDLVDLNFVIYRCEAEERDLSDGRDGVYEIPNYGPLVYAGLQGWWSVLEDIIKYNQLGHALCDHLRQGQWALDYVVDRMEKVAEKEGYTRLRKPAAWLKERFQAVRGLPNFLLPRYFAIIVQIAYNAAWKRGIRLLGKDICHGQEFIHQLAMVSVQMTGYVKSASLWPTKSVPCLASGLPHFSTDWARCWGRDVFISLRGLFLVAGRLDDAREHILAFASVLKHGMIPNLLSSGRFPRYNSRDSVWFFLQAIQDYTKMVPGGIGILEEKVLRRFLPYDDTWFAYDDPRAYSQSSTIAEIMQEVFQRHATGLSFREHNSGPDLDRQMKPEGFQIDVRVDWETGFIFGGNQFNCGTWQDKMGESEKAGNKGIPGTPRDGAAIEITGLLYSALKWVSELHQRGLYKHEGVHISNGDGNSFITFKSWAARIKYNFEHCYYVPLSPDDDIHHDVDPVLINRRGIYKDLYRSGKPYEDYQLRANFPIAMTVAPDLFTPSRALHALRIADSALLRGGLTGVGMATLDPEDLNYRPNYNNSEDSTDFKTARGRNYHQGPEWVWLMGYFLRALLRFDLLCRKKWKTMADEEEERIETFLQISRRLEGCKRALRESPWRGLVELTNKNGAVCKDSVCCLFASLLSARGILSV